MAYTERFKQPMPQPWDDEAKFDTQRETDLLMSAGESKSLAIATADFLSPYSPTFVTIDGIKYRILADEMGLGGDAVFWEIIVTDAKRGKFRLEPNGAGVLPAGVVSSDYYYEIKDIDKEFTAKEDNILYIRYERDDKDDFDIKMSLRYDEGWDEIPSVYKFREIEKEDDTPLMEQFNYPLYHTVTEPPGTAVGEEFYLRRLVPNNSFQINHIYVRAPGGSDVVSAIEFAPSFAAIP